MAVKKYVSLSNLSKFFDNIKNIFATKTEMNAKSDKVHTHSIANVTNLQSTLDGKAASSHGTHVSYSTTAPLMDGTASVGSVSTVARSDHRHPTDTSRAAQTSLDSHISNTTSHITSIERTNFTAGYTHSQSSHAPSNAEKNQNAFSNVKVGSTTIAADSVTDTLALVAGDNITLTPDANGDSITISATDTNTTYSAGTGISLSGTTFSNSGVRSVSTGSSNGTISVNTNGTSANVTVKGLGSAAYTASTAYDAAGTAQTKANAALASAKAYTDSVKSDLLNGAGGAYDTLKELGDLIDENVDAIEALETVAVSKASASDLTSHTSNKSNPHGVTLSQLGVTATASELNKMDGVTATTAELNIMDGVTATTAEINYLDGVTSNIQTQLDTKASSGHTHKYAGSSSAGGAATSANKLNTDAGSVTQPVYFSGGVPKATTYTLGKSVPSNAVFTDTHYASKNVVGATNATSNTATALSNGAVYLNSVENGTVTSSHKISGSGATTVTTDTNGNIVISSTDNNTTYSAAGSSLGLVKSGGDVTISSGVITVNDDSHNHTISNVDNLQSSLDAKQGTITGGASTITSSNLTVNRALISNDSGKVTVSAVTSTELGYLDGVTSNVQTQLNGKSGTSHTHSYAGSSSVGGSATSAVKLDTSTAGDSNTPVYFSGGKPVACTSLDLNTSGSSASCTGNSATATKLKTARSIGLGNDLTGSVTFDGGGDITISAKHYNVSVNSSNKSNYPYHRFAYKGSKASPITGVYNDTDAIFCIRETYNGGCYGVLKVSLRTNSSTSVSQASAIWLVRYNIQLDDVKIGLYNVAGSTYADLYIKVGTYARTTVMQLEGNRSWALISSNEVSDTTTSDALTSTECYTSIENAATTLHGQAYTSIISSVDGGQVNYANSAGSATTASTCSGNSATATKLSSAKTISLTGDVTGSASFDGSANASISVAVADDSHNHVISNIDGLQTALDGKSATSHTHTADNLVQWANALFATASNGGVEYSYSTGSGKNVLTEISNMASGLHTIYSIAGTTGNPKSDESWRMLVHKNSTTIGWVLAFDAQGSIYSNYQSAAGTFKGWRCVYDADPPILWMGEYWCTDTQTVTPSKALSACRNGWVLVWSDYDTENEKATNGDCFTTVIPKWNPNHVKWSGQSFIAAVPSGLNDSGVVSFAGKRLYVHDTKITGHTVNDVAPSNDVCLRAIYEY